MLLIVKGCAVVTSTSRVVSLVTFWGGGGMSVFRNIVSWEARTNVREK